MVRGVFVLLLATGCRVAVPPEPAPAAVADVAVRPTLAPVAAPAASPEEGAAFEDSAPSYVNAMHCSIHEAWAWGVLQRLAEHDLDDPLNDFDLWTRVELVLLDDGTIEKAITVRHSGQETFDEAAREAVFTAGAFPEPPAALRSANGKTYLHWAFHRDARACGTFGATPFVLEKTGAWTSPPLAGGEEPGSSPCPGRHEGLESNPEAQTLANAWLSHVDHESIALAASRCGLPFTSGDQVVARTDDELEAFIAALIVDMAGHRPKKPKLFAAAGLRRVLGSLPAGVHDDSRIYALTKVGETFLVVVLEKRSGSYEVVGIAR